MQPISQIIQRNLFRREACLTGLWINPEQDDGWLKVKEVCGSLKLFSQDYSAHTFLQQTGADVEFSAFPLREDTGYQWIILNLPRHKMLLQMMLDCAAGLLADNGVLWLAGENKAGIKSAEKHLKTHFARVRKLDNARHCTLYEADGILKRQAFDASIYQQTWALSCNDTGIDVLSYPGVFAHGRLDAGTTLLLKALADMRLEGDILDFGCGAGVIGACITATHPHTSVTLLDSSALALRSSRETLALNRLHGKVLASDGLSHLEGGFDAIISNPPIHAGVRTDNRLSMRLLERVNEHLNAGGMMIVVANIHLPYEGWLSQRFRSCKQLIANEHYKVLMARK